MSKDANSNRVKGGGTEWKTILNEIGRKRVIHKSSHSNPTQKDKRAETTRQPCVRLGEDLF